MDEWITQDYIEYGPPKANKDLIVVVRCRNCKYGEPDTNGNGEDMVMCQNKQNPIGYEDWLMPPEWFCADGERRESE